MAATYFPVTELFVGEGFQFVMFPDDETNEQQIEETKSALDILNGIDWEETENGLTAEDMTSTDSEDGDLLYLDAVSALQEAEHPRADDFVILNVVVIGELVIVNCTFASEDDGDDEEAAVVSEEEFD